MTGTETKKPFFKFQPRKSSDSRPLGMMTREEFNKSQKEAGGLANKVHRVLDYSLSDLKHTMTTVSGNLHGDPRHYEIRDFQDGMEGLRSDVTGLGSMYDLSDFLAKNGETLIESFHDLIGAMALDEGTVTDAVGRLEDVLKALDEDARTALESLGVFFSEKIFRGRLLLGQFAQFNNTAQTPLQLAPFRDSLAEISPMIRRLRPEVLPRIEGTKARIARMIRGTGKSGQIQKLLDVVHSTFKDAAEAAKQVATDLSQIQRQADEGENIDPADIVSEEGIRVSLTQLQESEEARLEALLDNKIANLALKGQGELVRSEIFILWSHYWVVIKAYTAVYRLITLMGMLPGIVATCLMHRIDPSIRVGNPFAGEDAADLDHILNGKHEDAVIPPAVEHNRREDGHRDDQTHEQVVRRPAVTVGLGAGIATEVLPGVTAGIGVGVSKSFENGQNGAAHLAHPPGEASETEDRITITVGPPEKPFQQGARIIDPSSQQESIVTVSKAFDDKEHRRWEVVGRNELNEPVTLNLEYDSEVTIILQEDD